MDTTRLTKPEIARRQLGTALHLFLLGKDPVSVHSLACAGCEIAERLAEQAGGQTMRGFRLAEDPSIDAKTYLSLRNQYWNAFKHSNEKSGADRVDDALLESFTDRDNEIRLFLGWTDYSSAVGSLPIEAQIFNTWFLAQDPAPMMHLPEGQVFWRQLSQRFPDLDTLSSERRMQRLRRAIASWSHDARLRADPRTELRPLCLD